MLSNEFLQQLADFDISKENYEYEDLIANLDLFEKAHSRFYRTLLAIKRIKMMQEFGERETDVHIVTYMKSGTTLTQMMLYQLTTDGNMDFKHLYDVSPWAAWALTTKKKMADVGERRIIKSHDEYEVLKNIKKGKFIFVMRDGLDVMNAIYHHVKNYYDPKVEFKDILKRHLKNWTDYHTKWLKNENNLDMLYLNYEDIIADKETVVKQIANFIAFDLTDEILARVLERSSFDFMKKHESKFGEQPNDWKVYNQFIRKGKAGEGKQHFSEEQLGEYKKLTNGFLARNEYMKRYFEG